MSYFVIKLLNSLAHVKEIRSDNTPSDYDYDFITGDISPGTTYAYTNLLTGPSLGTTLSGTSSIGATSLSVTSASGALTGEGVLIVLDGGRQFWNIVTDIVGTTVSIKYPLPVAATSGNQVVFSSQCSGQTDFTVEEDFKYLKYAEILGNTGHLRTTSLLYEHLRFTPVDHIISDVAAYLSTGRSPDNFVVYAENGAAYRFKSLPDLMRFQYTLKSYVSSLLDGQDTLISSLWAVDNTSVAVATIVDTRADSPPILEKALGPDFSSGQYGGRGRFQNLILYSESLAETVWLKEGSSPPSVASTTETAPNGEATATGFNVFNGSRIRQVLSLSASTEYRVAFWSAITSASSERLSIQLGTDGVHEIFSVPDYWEYYEFVLTTGAADQDLIIDSIGTASLLFWGFSVTEVTPDNYKYPYVKTTGVAVNSSYGQNINGDMRVTGSITGPKTVISPDDSVEIYANAPIVLDAANSANGEVATFTSDLDPAATSTLHLFDDEPEGVHNGLGGDFGIKSDGVDPNFYVKTGSKSTPSNTGWIKAVLEGKRVTTKSYAISGYGTSDLNYIAGFYEAPSTSIALTVGGSDTVTIGSSNQAIAAHAFCVASGPTAGVSVLTVSGISINDAGVINLADSEILVPDTSAVSTNQYFETSKKWLGQPTYTLTGAAGTFSFNYGFCKYEDFGNRDFVITDFEFVAKAAASEVATNVELLPHVVTGWTYAAAGFIPGSTAIVDMATDYSTNTNIEAVEYFAYKRAGLSTAINGSGSEGVLVRYTQSGNNSLHYGTAHITVLV